MLIKSIEEGGKSLFSLFNFILKSLSWATRYFLKFLKIKIFET